jgi:hypothetical protein
VLLLFGPVFSQELGEYQVILDRQLLGSNAPEPSEAVLTPPQTLPVPSWANQYRMTMMTMDQQQGAVRVGLQNLQDQSAVLLIQGQNRHRDFTLITADYQKGTAQIAYRGASHLFTLADAASASVAVPPVNNPRSTRPSSRPSAQPRTANRSSPRSQLTGPDESPSLQIRRFSSQEELQAHLMEQQMDAIRTGKPPLPLPLTPEMDAQLVREGILPPREQP